MGSSNAGADHWNRSIRIAAFSSILGQWAVLLLCSDEIYAILRSVKNPVPGAADTDLPEQPPLWLMSTLRFDPVDEKDFYMDAATKSLRPLLIQRNSAMSNTQAPIGPNEAIKVTNIEELDKKGIDRQKLVIDVHKVFFTMLLRHSIFHADPHPGNISVRDDGTLILYDFGMIGRLNNETRLRLVRLYLALVEKDPPRTVNAMDELGMLAPDFNREVIERGINMSIKSMYGKKPDEMEVEALMALANKTMSKFPFKLPKHLALYLRMSTIIEGIYHTHKVDFKFIKVLRQILEEESLIKDAYIEEIKHSFKRFAKTLDDTLTIAPEIKKFMDENRIMQQKNKRGSNTLLSGSILSGAVFFGSAFLFQSNETLGIIGMIASAAIMGIFVASRNR